MLVLCLAAVFAISTSVAQQSGSYRRTDISNIIKGVQVPETELSQPSLCPPGFTHSVNGMAKCYYVDNQPLSWDEASAKCNRLYPEAHLAVINSALEDQVISSILEQHECPVVGGWNGWFWIGGRRTSDNCNSPLKWRPTARIYQPIGYTNFCPREPDCTTGSPQYCLSAVKDCWARRNTYGWQDDACSHKRCAICEFLRFEYNNNNKV